MTVLAITDAAYAEANWGQWKARCPRHWCTNAMPLDRGQARFVCLGPDSCGWTGDVIWPPDPDAVETLLLMRPVPRTRNWLPGETLTDLLTENAVHGVTPAALDGGRPTVLAVIADDRLIGGLLHQQLAAAPRSQIGA